MAQWAGFVCLAWLLLGVHSAEEACEQEEASLLTLRQGAVRTRLPVRLECPDTPGVYWSVDGVNSSAVDFRMGWEPLVVANGSIVDIMVCSVAGPPLEGLILGVGAGARVRLAVHDSFNLVLRNFMVLGGALVTTLVRGPLLPGARLGMELTDSGNIRGQGGLQLRGRLLSPLLAGNFEGCRVRVVLRRCGNVELSEADQVNITSGSTLLDNVFRVDSVRASELVVKLEDSGNVRARSLSIARSQLMAVPVVARQWDASMLDLEAEAVASFEGRDCSIGTGGRLSYGVFRGEEVASPNISLQLSQACLVRAQQVTMQASSILLDRALDLPAVAGGELSLSMRDVASVNCSSLFMAQFGRLMTFAILSSGALSERAKVHMDLNKVAGVEAADAVLEEAYLVDNVLNLADPVSDNVVLDLQLSEVGILQGQSVRRSGAFASLAFYVISIARFYLTQNSLRRPSSRSFSVNFSLRVNISQSFNLDVAGDLVHNRAFLDVAIGSFQGCNVSFSLQGSGNVAARGHLELGGVADFVQRGGVRSSNYRMDIADSFNARAAGNLSKRGSLLTGIFGNNFANNSGLDTESSQISLRLLESLSAEAQGDVTVFNGAAWLGQVMSPTLSGSNASLLISESGNINAQGNVRLLPGSSVLRTLVKEGLRNSSLNLTLRRSGNVVGTDISTQGFRGVMGSLLAGGASDSKLELRVEAAGLSARESVALVDSEVMGSLVMERLARSELTLQASDFAGVAASDLAGTAGVAVRLQRSSLLRGLADCSFVNSSVHFELLRTAEVTVLGPTAVAQASAPGQSRGLVDRLLKSNELLGSNISVAARALANVRALSLTMEGSAALLAGLERSGSLANSRVELALEDSAGFNRGRRLEMRQSTLLGALFSLQLLPSGVLLRARLDFCAGLEASESALLNGSSLLDSGSLGLELRSTALACRTQRSAGALLTARNGTLCAGGAGSQASTFSNSCRSQLCAVKF